MKPCPALRIDDLRLPNRYGGGVSVWVAAVVVGWCLRVAGLVDRHASSIALKSQACLESHWVCVQQNKVASGLEGFTVANPISMCPQCCLQHAIYCQATETTRLLLLALYT